MVSSALGASVKRWNSILRPRHDCVFGGVTLSGYETHVYERVDTNDADVTHARNRGGPTVWMSLLSANDHPGDASTPTSQVTHARLEG